MRNWVRRLRGALGMGITWAFAWALGGVLIGLASFVLDLDWFFKVFDAPLPALALPGFFAGAFFSIVLGVAARNRRFSELSMPRFVAWGALGGVMLTLFPPLLVAIGLATPAADGRFWTGLAVVAAPFVLMSAGCAAATLAIARRGERAAAAVSRSVGQDGLDAPPAKPIASFQKLEHREKA